MAHSQPIQTYGPAPRPQPTNTNIWPSATPTAKQYKHMAEPQAHSQTIQTYSPAPHNRNIWSSANNRNIWPHNSRATAAPSRLADSFVWLSSCILITTDLPFF